MSISTYTIPAGDDLRPSRHAAVGGWFFGPRAENFDHLAESFKTILDNQKMARETTYPDTDFITADMKAESLYQEQIQALKKRLEWVTTTLSDTSVPFWSPRYNAHMSMEASMPAVIGYLAGLLHNQNNVATEASALTTWLETKVGRGLCRMLGYNTMIKPGDDTVDGKEYGTKHVLCPGYSIPRKADDPEDDEPAENRPIGWGHITCGGSVANLESIWAARNLKFYPLSLKLAIEDERNYLGFLKDKFKVQLCNGIEKLFMDCTTWELLNLNPSTVLNIPTRLYDTFGVSQTALTAAMRNYTIQSKGKDSLEKHFKIEQPPLILVGATRHYSWPKGAAIAGIGSDQVISVPVDNQARMDPEALDKKLRECANSNQAVYAVVAIMGSTEHGAVDPLVSVLKLRQKHEKEGLSFVVHCDAAWGGYFAACIRGGDGDVFKAPNLPKGDPSYVPTMALTPYTKKQLEWYGRADSITIDPHKSGYCPYPAGGLCYRDGRMRFLVTWTSPVVFRGEQESMGVYGVEGSKPGAVAVGTWLSHSIIGLDMDGYGTLLGEAIFTCAKLYCHWATMEFKEVSWKAFPGVTGKVKVTPFVMLPAEKEGKSQAEIDEEKKFIREHIIAKDNKDIMENERARKLIAKLGGDLQINTFAVNFELNGVVNNDVVEANYLNNRIFNRTSITDWQDKKKPLKSVKLFLTSTQLAQSTYEECLNVYKRRMGVNGPQDLYTLINVTMNPWATSYDFIKQIAGEFQTIANEELLHAVARNVQTADIHGFIIQGLEGDRMCGVHLPMFNMQNHRWQLIISFKLREKEHNMLRELKEKDPGTFFTLANLEREELPDLIKDGASFKVRLDHQIPDEKTKPLAEVDITDVKVLYKRSMRHEYLASEYPSEMIFYAYCAQRGTDSVPVYHIDHFLNNAFDIQLNSDSISIDVDGSDSAVNGLKARGAWLRLVDVHEAALQPLVQNEGESNTEYVRPGLNWKPREKFRFEALSEDKESLPVPNAPIRFTGTLTLGQSVFADSHMINMDAEVKEAEKPEQKMESVYNPHGEITVFGLSESNASGLVAEYPNDMQMPELRNRNQAIRMGNFKKALFEGLPPELRL